MNWSDRLSQLKGLLDSGRAVELAKALESLRPKSVPRRHAAELANLARRAGEYHYALRVLAPHVSAEGATPKEVAIYAAALNLLGGTEEALAKLTALPRAGTPQAALYLAHAHFASWDYAAAIPILEELLKSADLEKEMALIARVNLAAALVHEKRREPARALLGTLTATARAQLLGNVYELLAQLEIAEGNWDAAERALTQARALLASASRLERLFVEKWALVLELTRRGPSKDLEGRWAGVRAEAADIGHPETLRDMDLRWAQLAGDDALLWRVYFGTPWERFRERIFRDSPRPLEPPESFLWAPGHGRPWPRAKVVLSTEALSAEGYSVPRRVVLALTTDFYRPFTVVQLHRHLYPEEHYNPTSSPGRVHEAVAAARDWLREEGLPLEVALDKSGYCLRATGPGTIEVTLTRRARSREEDRLERLSRHFGDRPFDVKEAADHLGISPRSANRILGEGIARDRLEKLGAGKRTVYTFRK